MKKHLLFATCLLSAFAVAACGGDDSKQVPDAARAPDACVGNCGATPDAPVTQLPVKVVALLGNQLSVGTTVLFLQADNTVISTKVTDANGEATELMPDGGSVTVVDTAIRTKGSDGQLITFVAVKPGDVLTTGGQQAGERPATERSVQLPLTPRGSTIDVSSICGNTTVQSTGGPLTVPITLFNSCTTVNFFVDVRGANGNEFGQLYKSNVAVPASGVIDLSAEVLKPAKEITVSLTNLPAGTNRGALSLQGFDGTLQMRQPGVSFTFQAPGTHTGSTLIGDTAAPETQAVLNVNRPNGQLFMFDRTVPGNYSLDVNSVMIPALVTSPTKTDTTTLGWAETNEGQADTSLASILVARPNPVFRFSHVIVAPHQIGTLKLPVLPTAFDKFNIQVEDAVNVQQFILARSSLGYDHLRQNLIKGFDNGASDLLPAGSKLTIGFADQD